MNKNLVLHALDKIGTSLSTVAKNCGNGAGGFQPGNSCAGGGGGGGGKHSKLSMKEVRALEKFVGKGRVADVGDKVKFIDDPEAGGIVAEIEWDPSKHDVPMARIKKGVGSEWAGLDEVRTVKKKNYSDGDDEEGTKPKTKPKRKPAKRKPKKRKPKKANTPEATGKAAAKAMPAGTKKFGDSKMRWSKSGGYAGQKTITRTREKLMKMGFTADTANSGGSPDGSVISNSNTLTHPHGHKFYSSASYGVTATYNSYSMELTLAKPASSE